MLSTLTILNSNPSCAEIPKKILSLAQYVYYKILCFIAQLLFNKYKVLFCFKKSTGKIYH